MAHTSWPEKKYGTRSLQTAVNKLTCVTVASTFAGAFLCLHLSCDIGNTHADLPLSYPPPAPSNPHCPAEKGYNAIEFEAAVNSWIRRIRITNSDANIKLYSSMFNTVSEVQITQTRPRSGGKWTGRTDGLIADKDGHIGIALHWASFDNLVEKFNISG